MVRFATLQLRAGDLPLTSWFPYLGLGSPQFLHYQSLPAMITGLIGIGVGPDTAFRWTLYILLCAWPISVYLGARLFGISRWGAASSAAISPFLMSAAGVGYEQKAYLWIGYGVWTQLWASLSLPLAWGLSWRAIRDGKNFFIAVVAVSITAALHFETGYLAFAPLLVWPLVSPKSFAVRAARAGFVGCGAIFASAWIIVPLIADRSWAATNEILRNTALVNGYGASRVVSWLASGKLLDADRLPIVTVLAGIGLVLVCLRWTVDENGRGLVVALVACLLLSFGRTTLGALVDAIPGSGDIFFRRFTMGVQLALVLLAGIGLSWCGRNAMAFIAGKVARSRRAGLKKFLIRLSPPAVRIACAIVLLAPAWVQLYKFDRDNAASIEAQADADRSQGSQVNRLVAIVKRQGGGRIYAGMPANWGMNFTVGAVPVFKYLESTDTDEVGYTLRTASLMTDPEFYFDEENPGDYTLFGVRYLILPRVRPPPVPARVITCASTYCLWQLPDAGYVHVGQVVGTLSADRSTVGARSVGLLRSPLPNDKGYLRLSFGQNGPVRERLSRFLPRTPGFVVAETSNLDHGQVRATVSMREAGIVVLSSSLDRDGRSKWTGILAPSCPWRQR